jgi:hypothetical protein
MTALLILMLMGHPAPDAGPFWSMWKHQGDEQTEGYYVTTDPEVIGKVLDKWIIKRLTEYADECYADSTTRYTILSCDSAMYWEQIKLPDAKRNYLFRIVHKQPTFPDFINWLKRRTP